MSRPNLLQYLSERVGLGGEEGRDLRVDHGPDGAPVLADVIRLGWQVPGNTKQGADLVHPGSSIHSPRRRDPPRLAGTTSPPPGRLGQAGRAGWGFGSAGLARLGGGPRIAGRGRPSGPRGLFPVELVAGGARRGGLGLG